VSYKRTLIIFLLFAAAAVFFYLYEIQGGQKRREAGEQAKRVLSFDPADAASVLVARADETIVVKKGNGEWVIAEPVKAAAEQPKIKQLITAAAEVKFERDLGEQGELKPFGLDQPDLSIEIVSTAGKSERVLIGSTTPDGKNVYMKKEDAPNVFTVAVSAKDALDQDLYALRDKKLVQFSTPDVEEIALHRDGKSVTLRKEDENRWRMVSPAETDADTEKINTLLDSIRYARVKKFVEENAPDLHAYGLEPAEARVELGLGDNREVIYFGAKPAPDTKVVYAVRGEDGRRVLELDDAILEKVTASPDEWRDERLAKFDPESVRKLEIETNNSKLSVKQDENSGKWLMLEPRETRADASRIESLLRGLAKMKAVRFVRSDKEAQSRLKQPQLRLRLWVQDENEPILVSFTQMTAEEEYLSVLPSGELCVVDAEAVKEMSVEPDDLIDKSVAHFEAADIEKIDLIKGEETYSIKRKDVSWNIPRKLNAESYEVDQLLWELSRLKYVNVISGETQDASLFKSPALGIRLWSGEGTEPEVTLVVGERLPAKETVYIREEGSGQVMEVEAAFLAEWVERL